jgi:hypothetical protein
LRLIKKGKIEIAEISGVAAETESDFAARLRDLEELKKDGILSKPEKLNQAKIERWWEG